MESVTVGLGRPIYLTREGNTLKLAFSYDEKLVNLVKTLPYAKYDGETRTWTTDLTAQAVDELRTWYLRDGLTDVCVDELVNENDTLPHAAPATLRGGSLKRPFIVIPGTRDDQLYNRLRSIGGAQWERAVGGLSYPSTSAAALAELVERGVIADPEGVLTPAAITITYDARAGAFAVLGDKRASVAFAKHFPSKDVVALWKEKGFDIGFADPFSEEVYRGEIARAGVQLRPQGLREELFAYQAESVAVAVERSGFGIFDAPGLGKTAQAIAWGYELVTNRGEAPRTLVVTPGAVKTQFAREITRFTGQEDVVVIDGDKKKRLKLYEQAADARWVVLNYDLLHLDYKHIAPLASGALLIADEAHRCLPGHARVLTQNGWRAIADIVDNKETVPIAALDPHTKAATWQEITAWMVNETEDPMTTLWHERGEITATFNHPIWVEGRGWVDAFDVQVGDAIVLVNPDDLSSSPSVVHATDTVSDTTPTRVYNLEVSGPHTYVADSILVHNCKNRTSKRTQAMRQLAQKAARRLALTGTPIENNPAEWYTLMSTLVAPGALGAPMDYLNRYCYPGRFGGFEGARNLPELKARSAPHYIRHTKEQVATHLPPLRVQNVVLDPDEKLAAALKRAHRDAQVEIAEAAKAKRNLGVLDGELADELETGAAMTAVGMLRLMCSSPRLVHVSDSESAKAMIEAGLIPDEDGPKLEHLRELALAMHGAGERLIVFTGFASMARLISERLEQDGISHVTYTGATSTKERDAAVKAFTTPATPENPGPTVFLATDAGSEGLNLGKCCSTLVNFDLSFKPSTMIQRANRIHRIDGDPDRKYLVINYTLSRTVEEGILRLVGAKADLADAILGEAGGRRSTTGRGGRNVFEQALHDWQEHN